MSHRGGHAADLPVLTFGYFELDPPVGNGLANPDGDAAVGDVGRFFEQADGGGGGAMAFDRYTVAQVLERRVRGYAFDLGPIGAGDGVARFGQDRSQGAVLGQDEQAFAVSVETTSAVEICGTGAVLSGLEVDVVGQGGAPVGVGELREDVVGFPKRQREQRGRGGFRGRRCQRRRADRCAVTTGRSPTTRSGRSVRP